MNRCSCGTTRSIIRFGMTRHSMRIEALQVGVRADGRDHVGAGEVVDVVGQRRQRMGQDRHRHRNAHHARTGPRWSSGGPSAGGAVRCGFRRLGMGRSWSFVSRRPPEEPAECNISAGPAPPIPPFPLRRAPAKRHRRSRPRTLSRGPPHDRLAARYRPRPVGGAAAHAALRRGNRGGEIRRPRHGRGGDGQELRPRHRADGADRHQSGGRARRRAADRRDAQAARHQVGIRRRPAHHRRRHHRDRRDGAGGLDQQADRGLHQRGRRQGGRPVRQGRQHGQGAQDQPHASPIPAPISRR